MKPVLTIIAVWSNELPFEYLERYLTAMYVWNRVGENNTQLILILQRPLPAVCESVSRNGFKIVQPEYEKVNGYPVWDVMKTVRDIWAEVQGEYVTFNHMEFIWGPDRVQRTIDWLTQTKPVYVVGNLRRPGSMENVADRSLPTDIVKEHSDWLTSTMDAGEWDVAAKIFEMMETTHWMYWDQKPQQPGLVNYIEDLFIAKKSWLDAWGFTKINFEMPFQDVYDLIGIAFQSMYKFNAAPQCVRPPQSVNKVIHLWHPREWLTWTVEMRNWFFADRKRWEGTRYVDPKVWNDLIQARMKGWPKDHGPANDLRRGPGGPVTRYGMEVSVMLQRDRAARLKQYYAKGQ